MQFILLTGSFDPPGEETLTELNSSAVNPKIIDSQTMALPLQKHPPNDHIRKRLDQQN